MRDRRQTRVRVAIAVGIVIVIVVVFAIQKGSVSQRGPASQADCPERITVGAAGSVRFTAYDVQPNGLGCTVGVKVVNDLLGEETVGKAASSCAAAARTQAGCLVDGYRCRTRDAGTSEELCASGAHEVIFQQVRL